MVVEDPDDDYSHNLAEDFTRHFEGFGGHRVVRSLGYGEGEPSTGQDLLQEICQAVGPRDFLFYASRAQQLPALLSTLDSAVDCGDRQLTVIAGSDVTKFVTDGTIRTDVMDKLRLYSVAFSSPGDVGTAAASDFVRNFARAYPNRADSDAAVAFDAFHAAEEAINLAYQEGGNANFDRGVVAAKLFDGLVTSTGASGLITFDGRKAQRVPPGKPVLIVEDGQDVLMSCGRFSSTLVRDRWGPNGQHRCPADD